MPLDLTLPVRPDVDPEDNHDAWIHWDFRPPTDTLLIAFTGKQLPSKRRGFNFAKLCRQLDCRIVFVRDLENHWFHSHSPEYGRGVDGLTDTLRTLIAHAACRRVVTVGGSMGGYGAILLGQLLQVDTVLAIAPQTYLTTGKRLRNLDFRGWKLKQETVKRHPEARPYFDLRNVLSAQSNNRTRIHVHTCWNRIDRRHSDNIAACANVETITHETHRHDLALLLKRRESLLPIMRNLVDPASKIPSDHTTVSGRSLRSRLRSAFTTR